MSEEWQMLFNTSKSRVMHFGRSNDHVEYQMNNQKLEVIAEVKDLGVIISRDLKALPQCIHTVSQTDTGTGPCHSTQRA